MFDMRLNAKMSRAVSRDDKLVEFVNGAAGFVGTPYKYECLTATEAIMFEAYCNKRDPKNEDLPIAVGPEVAALFGAVKTS